MKPSRATLARIDCGSDTGHARIAGNHGFDAAFDMQAAQVRTTIAIDDDMGWRTVQAQHGASHRQHGRLQDVDRVDLGGVGPTKAPGDGACADLEREFLADFRREDLRVGDAANLAPGDPG
jgi:hypothetical protein